MLGKIMDLSPGIGLAWAGLEARRWAQSWPRPSGLVSPRRGRRRYLCQSWKQWLSSRRCNSGTGLIATLASRRYEALLLDVQDARKQHKDHWMPAALTITLVLMVSSMLAGLFYLTVPEGNKDVITSSWARSSARSLHLSRTGSGRAVAVLQELGPVRSETVRAL